MSVSVQNQLFIATELSRLAANCSVKFWLIAVCKEAASIEAKARHLAHLTGVGSPGTELEFAL